MRKIKEILNNNSISPNIKRLLLKKRAGIQLSECEEKRLDEMIGMILPMKYHSRMGVQNSINKSIKIEDDDEEIDLQTIIDELEAEEELEIGDTDNNELREYIYQFIKEEWLEKLKKL